MKLVVEQFSKLSFASVDFVHGTGLIWGDRVSPTVDDGSYPYGCFKLRPESLNLPSCCDGVKPKVLGSCKGLVCFFIPPSRCILWNPQTRTHKEIQIDPRINMVKIDGFGYDKVNLDFKLVTLSMDPGDDRCQTHVLSFDNGTTRNIVSGNNMFGVTPDALPGIYVDRFLYFKVLQNNGKYDILSYHILEEKQELLLIKPYSPNSTFELGVLDGYLSMVYKIDKQLGASFQVVKMGRRSQGEFTWEVVSIFHINNTPRYMRPIMEDEINKLLMLEGDGELFCINNQHDQQVMILGMDCQGFTQVCLCDEVSGRMLDLDDVAGRFRDPENNSGASSTTSLARQDSASN